MELSWVVIIGVAGGIVTLSNAIKALVHFINPFTNLKKKIEKHDELLENDNRRLNGIEDGQKVICKSILALLDHEITGNSTDKLRLQKNELQNYLIDK